MKEKEQRLFFNISHSLEHRDDNTDDMILEGYACVFDETTLIGSREWGFYERVDRNAFNGADISDVPLKYNHTDNVPILARTRNGSLSLNIDDKGLKIRAKLLDTQDARDMYKRVQEGLIDKMSFAFTVSEQSFNYDTEPVTRTILKFDKIFDVSVVDVPAYDGTSVNARSLDLLEGEIKEALEKAKRAKRDYRLAGVLTRYSKN